MKLAIYQCSGTFLDTVQNMELLAQTAAAAANQQANFLILPELFLTGYNLGDEIKRLAQPRTGKILQQAAQIARQYQLAILLGYAESDQGVFYNSALLIDSTGNLVGNYRKIHLFGDQEKRLFQPGHQWLLHTIAGLKVGVLICYDIEFPEAVRTLALQGAELIAVPTAITHPYTSIPNLVIPTRALENQVFVAYVNRIGKELDLEYFGLSRVIGPDGSTLAVAGTEETLLTTELDRGAILRERSSATSYLQERQPTLYFPHLEIETSQTIKSS
jgi:predicted amidohydrolase